MDKRLICRVSAQGATQASNLDFNLALLPWEVLILAKPHKELPLKQSLQLTTRLSRTLYFCSYSKMAVAR